MQLDLACAVLFLFQIENQSRTSAHSGNVPGSPVACALIRSLQMAESSVFEERQGRVRRRVEGKRIHRQKSQLHDSILTSLQGASLSSSV
eukprot:1158786-Pelagomonas_calceolata.AAC.12